MVLAVAVLVLLVLLILQWAAAAFAGTAVRAAADRALEVARDAGGTDAAARAAATSTLHTLAGHTVTDVSIRITRSPTRIRVQITAATGRILGVAHTTTAVAAGPAERLTTPPPRR